MSTEPQTPVETPLEKPIETRLPYDAEFVKHAEEFSAKTMSLLPELQGVAIIPLWTHQPKDFPPGFLRLRAQNRMYMPELLKLMSLLTAFGVDAQKDFMGQIRILDNYLQELTTKLKEAENVLAEHQTNEPQQ
jgi:hypothetical protein